MRTQKIFSRLLVPTMAALLLLPPLSCLVFHQAAKQYAYDEALQELKTLQERMVPALGRTDSSRHRAQLLGGCQGRMEK